MKVLHICPFVGEQLGGSERYVNCISREQALSCEVHVFTTTKYPGRAGFHRLKGVSFHRFYSPAIVWNINPIVLAIRPILKSTADVLHIHSYLYTTSNQAVLAKILAQKPALLHLHGGLGSPPYKTKWVRRMAKKVYDRTLGRFTIENSNLIASVCQQDLKYISNNYSISEDRLRYVPNAIDTMLFRPHENNESERDFLYVGDLEKWKGVGLLLKWISRYNRDSNDPGFTLRFVGQGSLSTEIQQLANTQLFHDATVKIELMGPKSHKEVADLMRKSSALILPSYWEGMPTVLLEAMASGIPAISTPVGGVPEVIEHMKTGILMNPSYKGFRQAITTVIEDKKRAREISKNARDLILRDFSINRVANLLTDIYTELLTH